MNDVHMEKKVRNNFNDVQVENIIQQNELISNVLKSTGATL